MSKKTLRPAIAMIELIFAIVVIGIILMSAPQLIRTAVKSGYLTIQQEAISEASSHINMIMGYHWDENDTNETSIDPILKVTAGDSDLDNTTTHRRKGTPIQSYRSFIRYDGKENLTASVNLGSENSDEDDIDDFSSINPIHLKDVSSGAAGNVDYIEKALDISITTTVSYINDTPFSGTYTIPDTGGIITYHPDFNWVSSHSGTTNIKGITVTLIDNSGVGELEKTITLHTFSCNIGGYKLEEKSF